MSNYAKGMRIPKKKIHIPDKRILIIREIQEILKYHGMKMTQPEVRDIIKIIFDVIGAGILRDKRVLLSGVGSLKMVTHKPHWSNWSQKFGPPRKKIQFTPSKEVLQGLNPHLYPPKDQPDGN